MFIKRFILACVTSAVLFSATAQATMEVLPMPRVVQVAKFDLVSFARAIHGLKLNFNADYANLQGQEIVVETRLCDRNGGYLTLDHEHHILYSERVTPGSHSETRRVECRVSAETIKQLYGSDGPQIYVKRVIRNAATGALLADSAPWAIANKLPPMAPVDPGE